MESDIHESSVRIMRENEAIRELRRIPRYRVSVPFPCAFARMGLARWRAEEKGGYGVVYDVSLKGARVMSSVAVAPGDQLAVSLRLPTHPVAMTVDATVRWRNEHVFGLEFGMVSQAAETRLRKYLERV